MVVNLQGDLPALDPAMIRAVADALAATGADIATLAAEIDDPADRDNPNVVKPVVAWDVDGRAAARFISPARARRRAKARCSITSAFMPFAARRLRASSRCRPRRSNSARSSNSCARWKRA